MTEISDQRSDLLYETAVCVDVAEARVEISSWPKLRKFMQIAVSLLFAFDVTVGMAAPSEFGRVVQVALLFTLAFRSVREIVLSDEPD